MLKPGVSYQSSFTKANIGAVVGKQVGDTPLVVLTKDDGERTVYLAEVERLHFDKSPLEPRSIGRSSVPSPGSLIFNCAHAEEPSDFFKGGRRGYWP